MLKQRSQNTTGSRTAIRAPARVRASASGARRRWYVSRCAVFGPIPGSRANDSISRATGSISVAATTALEARDPESAGHGSHLLLGEASRGAERVVDGGHDQVLEHLDVRRVDGGRVDRDRDELLLAGHDGLHDAAAGGAVDLGVAQLALDALHLLLHLLGHALQVAHPHRFDPPLATRR